MSVSTVSATGIQDPTGQVFANGTWRLEFVPTYGTPGIYNDGGLPFTKQYGGSLDATGSFSQAGVNRSDTIAPAGSQWRFTAIPAVSGTTYSVLLNINSPAFDVTAAINAVITNIVVSPTSISRAYKDAELINVDGSGAIYYDETLKVLKVWDAVTSSFLPITPNAGSPTFNNLIVTGQALVKNFENIRFADQFASLNAAVADLGGASGKVIVPAGTYPCTASIAPVSTETIIIEGVGDASIVKFTGATDGFNNCILKDIQVQTSNAAGGVAVKFSGLAQYAENVHISQTGIGLWAKGIYNFGAVTLSLYSVYITSGSCTIGVDTLDNVGNQPGAFNLYGCELRGANPLHLVNVLSGNMYGGAIESATTNGVLAETTASIFNFFGVHFETNGVNDVQWNTGGQLGLYGCTFSGGTTNNLNCPNATCTAQVNVWGCRGSTTGAWIFGNAIALGSSLEHSVLKQAAFTVGISRNLTRIGNRATDGVGIPNVFGQNDDSVSRFDMVPGAGGTTITVQSDNAGNFTLNNNGLPFLQNIGDGNTRIPQSLSVAEAAAPSGVALRDILYADSTAHRLKMNNNNAGAKTVAALEGDTFTTPIINSGMQFNGATSGSTNLTPQPIAGSTSLLLPAATDTLVAKATTDTLSNKTLTGTGSGNSVVLLNSQGSLAAVTGTGADAQLYTFTIPANTIQAGKGIRLTVVTQHTTGNGAVTYKLKLGATTLVSDTITSNAGVGNDDATYRIMNNAGVQNAQTWSRALMFINVGTGATSARSGTSAENTANALALTYTMNAAGTEQVTPIQCIIEQIQ